MGDCYFLCGRSGVPGPLWLRIVSDASGSLFAVRCNRKELSKTTVSFWLRMPLSWESCLSATGRSVSCPLSSLLFVLLLRLFFVKNFAVILVEARESALALFLAWLLGGCRFSVARKLPLVLCGSGIGPGLSRAHSLNHLLLIHPSPDVPLSLSFFDGKCLSPHICILIFSWKYVITFFIRLSRPFLQVTF